MTLAPFPRRSPRVVEASVRLSSGARRATGAVVVQLRGTPTPDGPDRIAILDGPTGGVLASCEIPAELPATVRFDDVPAGDQRVVAYRSGESARRRYTTGSVVRLEADGPARPQVEVALDASVATAVALVEAVRVPADGARTPVTARLARPDDPAWTARPLDGEVPMVGFGSVDAVLEFDGLGAGRYELQLQGIEPEPGTNTTFDAPLDGVLAIRGTPR